jgi:hypothetical protein
MRTLADEAGSMCRKQNAERRGAWLSKGAYASIEDVVMSVDDGAGRRCRDCG